MHSCPACRGRLSGRRITITCLAVLSALMAVLVLPQIGYLQQVRHYSDHNPELTAFMRERLNEMRAENRRARIDHEWVDYSDISPVLIRAVIAAEDGRFLDHSGFDWEAMHTAWRAYRDEGRPLRGASTISQQLAKNLFLSETRSYTRKAREAAITVMIEQSMDKRRIIELYVNVIEWGDGVFGIEAAARRFHGVAAADLDAWQAARLAARIPRPRFYDHNGETTFLIRRAAMITQWLEYTSVP